VVNNPGTFGTIILVPIINQPHVGMLSMDVVVKRPVVIEDKERLSFRPIEWDGFPGDLRDGQAPHS
jgi:pyruvate/2-oxoglutarate dehydrogenase complex dihydrolipoamide acyltransferase (E2) component